MDNNYNPSYDKIIKKIEEYNKNTEYRCIQGPTRYKE